jgi:hypothetical protein
MAAGSDPLKGMLAGLQVIRADTRDGDGQIDRAGKYWFAGSVDRLRPGPREVELFVPDKT